MLMMDIANALYIGILSLLLVNNTLASGSANPYLVAHQADLAQEIINGWNAISPTYLVHKLTDMHPGDLLEAASFQDLINKYAKHAKVILDAGTGNGWFASSLLKWDILDDLERIIGIDISPIMIANARSHCSDPRAVFFCVSLESSLHDTICLGNESVDLIISSNALDCMLNIEQVLEKLFQLLKPKSFAIISIRHPLRNVYYITGSIDGDLKEGAYKERWLGTGDQEVIRFYRTEAAWDNLFKATGFKIIEKNIPVISELYAQTYPELYHHYKNKKHPGALLYVLKRPSATILDSTKN